jgi:integrase
LLLDVCKSFKFKAIILAQAFSGLSIVDVVNLKIKDFKEGLIELNDIKICRLTLERNKTNVKFTTFLSDESITAIDKYLEFERIDPKPEEALFSSYKDGGRHMTTSAIQESYRILNRFPGWKSEKGKFSKATSHMMRKFFNTQLINAGMPEEIREHMMGHTLKDKVREAYFLADPVELQKVYLEYMEHVTIRNFNFKPVDAVYDKRMNEMEAVILEIKNKIGEWV